ncbi:MAG: FISUMP domain-containing protein [Acidobacteriota bacterium]
MRHWAVLLMVVLQAMAAAASLLPTKPGEYRDPRDGQSYPTVQIAGMTWMAKNLNFASKESYCYQGSTENCLRYGRLYRWEAALSACPPGWHMSTEYEWQALELAMGISRQELNQEGNRGSSQGARLKEGGDSGFNAQMGGWRRSEDSQYEAAGRAAALWTATESNLERAWHRDVDTGDDQIWRSPVIKPYGLSVRCVQNHDEDDGK